MSSPDPRMPAAPAYLSSSIASDVSLGDNDSVYPPREYNNTVDPPVPYNNNAYLSVPPVPPLPFGMSAADYAMMMSSPRVQNGSVCSDVQWRPNDSVYPPVGYNNNAYLPVGPVRPLPFGKSAAEDNEEFRAMMNCRPQFCIASDVQWRPNKINISIEYNDIYRQLQPLYENHESNAEIISEIVTTMNDHLIPTVPTRSPTSKPWTICRVPDHLKDAHEHGFHPKLISIGPFHRHQLHLAAMEEHKTRFLLRLLNSMITMTWKKRIGNTNYTTPVGESESSNLAYPTITKMIKLIAVKMDALQANAKACYSPAASEHSDLPHDFVMMLILDGCFVVELLRLYAKCEKENDDPIFSTRWMLPKLQHDLLLFENQLPYFVLNKIFEITSSEEERKETSLARLALNFFDPLLPREQKLLEDCTLYAKPDHHLLGLFRSSFLRSFIIKTPAVEKRQLIHCVSELKEAGIMFKKRKNHDLLDIEFKNGILYIPPISIDDHTNPVFLNFIAYEQCNINAEPYFTHYFLFLDSLVNSSKDVEHLHHRGIINHVLGSDEDVANLFNNLCKEVVHDVNNCYLSQVLKDVNKYFHIKRHKWWATWKHDYFRNPWAISSFLAAILLILLTAIQSFFSVFSYFLPPAS